MGNCVGGFKRRTTRIAPWKRNRPIVLSFLGIDGAGKTTIVKALQGEDLGTVHPTVGFSRAEMRVKKYRFTVYDLGGSARIREIWSTYFAELYGVVFVVDASASSRLQENKQMVDSLAGVPELQGKPILFLLNKKDLPEALDEMQFSDRFGLHSMAKQNKTDIRVVQFGECRQRWERVVSLQEGVCAVKGTGKEIDQVIVEGVEWLIEKVLDNYDGISKGVEQALKKLRERQAQERLERQHRLALSASKESPERAGTPADEQTQDRQEGGRLAEAEGEGGSGTAAAQLDDERSKENGRIELRPGTGNAAASTQPPVDYRVFEISRTEEEEGGQANEAVAEEIEMRPTGSAGAKRAETAAGQRAAGDEQTL